MKILNVIPSVSLEGGGPIEGIRQSLKNVIDEGSSNTILCMDLPSSSSYIDFCTDPMNLSTKVFAVGPSYTKWGYCPRLAPWLREHASDYDAVIVHGIWMYHGLAVRKVLAGTGVPYFVYTHGMLDPWFKKRYPLKHLKKCLFWPWAEYRVLRDAKAVLFTCEEERNLARRSFYFNKWNDEVVSYGTKGPTGDSEAQKEQFFSAFPDLKGKRLFLFLSRIHPKKGCDLLINAFSKIVEQDPTVHLVMAGPDHVGLRDQLQLLVKHLDIENHVSWVGMLKDDIKWGAYRSSEVFCLTSHQENFGIVVAEALACGIPVLITTQVNIWREIAHSNAGLVEVDTQAGADKLLSDWMQLTITQKNEMSLAAKLCFNSKFEISRAVKSLLKVIEP